MAPHGAAIEAVERPHHAALVGDVNALVVNGDVVIGRHVACPFDTATVEGERGDPSLKAANIGSAVLDDGLAVEIHQTFEIGTTRRLRQLRFPNLLTGREVERDHATGVEAGIDDAVVQGRGGSAAQGEGGDRAVVDPFLEASGRVQPINVAITGAHHHQAVGGPRCGQYFA